MPAVLRASGTDFDVDSFCSQSGLDPCNSYSRGDPIRPSSRPDGGRHQESGLTIEVSEGGFKDFPRQVEETIEFLNTHRKEIKKLRAFPGVESVDVDFGVAPASPDTVVTCKYLPPELIQLAGELGLGLEVSVYLAISDDSDE